MSRLDILLADDHALMRLGLTRLLEDQPEWRVVAEAANGLDAVRLASEKQPAIAILDITMPVMSGIEATRQLRRRMPDLRILILSMHDDETHITHALQAGAHGYLLKDSAGTDLIRAVTSVAGGSSYFSPAVARVMLDEYVQHVAQKGGSDRYDLLTGREREIFQLIAEGRSNKTIAEVLSVSPATIETHRARIFQKLNLHSAAELVLFAARRGMLT